MVLDRKEYMKAWRLKNKDKVRENRKAYNLKNKEKIKEKQKESYLKNKEQLHTYKQQYEKFKFYYIIL